MRLSILLVVFGVMISGCSIFGFDDETSKAGDGAELDSSSLDSPESKISRIENDVVHYLREDPRLSVRYNDSDGMISVMMRSGNLFDKNSDGLSSELIQVLDRIAAKLVASGSFKMKVIGHTDNRGDSQYNVLVSEKRAKAVRSYLINKGINEASITSEGKGSLEPIVSNATSEGRNVNRRIDLVIRFRGDI